MPILGINVGKVGFLSKVEADELESVLGQLVAGEYTIERADGARGRGSCPAAGARPRRRSWRSTTSSSRAARWPGWCRLDVAIDELAPRDVHRRRPRRRQPDRLDRLLVLRRRPDPRPDSRNLVVTPIAGVPVGDPLVVVAPDQVVRCRVVDAHEALVTIDGREDRRVQVGDVVEVRALRAADPVRRAARARCRSGTCCGTRSSCCRPDRGTRPRAGRLLELAVTDLALIDRLRLRARGPASTSSPARPAPARACSSMRWGSCSAAAPTPTLVRHGAEQRRVEALFDRVPEPLIGVRELSAGGRSMARIDDETVTAGRLADDVGPLVEIHGQHEQQRLLDERLAARPARRVRRARRGSRAAVAGAVDAWRANRAALASWRSTRASCAPAGAGRARGDEIAARAPAAGRGGGARGAAGGGPARRDDRARRAERCARCSSARGAARGTVGDGAARAARRWRGWTRAVAALADRLAGLEAELEDVAAEVRPLAETVDHDPAALRALEERLGRALRLLRRYGDDEAAVIAHGERVGRGGRAAARPRGRARATRRRGRAAAARGRGRGGHALDRRARRRAGRSPATSRGPRGARVPGGRVRRGAGPAARGPGRSRGRGRRRRGRVRCDRASTRSCSRSRPNPGEPARPLARIASGGELSRVALAIKQVLAEVDHDADARVRRGRRRHRRPHRGPGRAAACGRSPARHQVLCVTHLPQIAAYADAHSGSRSASATAARSPRSTGLDRDERGAELAQMIGGPDGRRGRRSCRRASCSTAPRRGAPVASRRSSLTVGRSRRDLDAAIEEYLAYLRVERGLADATLRAYRADLTDFAMSRGAARDVGRRARGRRCAISPRGRGAADRATRASRRRASGGARPSIRGFYGSPSATGSSAATSRRTSTCRASRGCSRRR